MEKNTKFSAVLEKYFELLSVADFPVLYDMALIASVFSPYPEVVTCLVHEISLLMGQDGHSLDTAKSYYDKLCINVQKLVPKQHADLYSFFLAVSLFFTIYHRRMRGTWSLGITDGPEVPILLTALTTAEYIATGDGNLLIQGTTPIVKDLYYTKDGWNTLHDLKITVLVSGSSSPAKTAVSFTYASPEDKK